MNITPQDNKETGTVYCTGDDGCYGSFHPEFWNEHLKWHATLVHKVTVQQLYDLKRAGKS